MALCITIEILLKNNNILKIQLVKLKQVNMTFFTKQKLPTNSVQDLDSSLHHLIKLRIKDFKTLRALIIILTRLIRSSCA